MNLSPKEEQFIKTAVKLGYLTTEQASSASALRGSMGNIAQILVKKGYLTPQQATRIFKHIAALAPGEGAEPIRGTTPAPSPRSKTTRSPSRSEDRDKEAESIPQSAGVTTDSDKTVVLGDKSALLKESQGLAGEALKVGEVWGDYEILQEIGRGGMGIVYKACQQGTKRLVALKVMLTGSMAGSSETRRFLREAKAAARLDHPNIVSVFTMGEEKGYSYFTMEYIEGTTFEDWIDRKEIELKDKVEVLMKVARALQHAHERKILHRDIKPSNILINRTGEPYLTDFGLAKFVDSNSRLTQTGHALGTPFYMPPEQAKGDKSKIGPASDVYSLGVVLYQTLAGRLPFTSETLADLYRKILTENPIPPSTYDPTIPHSLQAICLKAMEKDIRFRYRSAAAFASDLARFRKGKKVEASRFSLAKTLVRNVHYVYRSPKLVAAIALGVVVLLTLFVWHTSSREWRKPWKAAQHAFERGEYREALEALNRVKNHPNPKEVEKFREEIYVCVENRATDYYKRGEYDEAFKLSEVATASKRMVRLRAEILEAKGQYEEMRLELTKLYELKPGIDELSFMGEKALNRGYFEDAARFLRTALDMSPGSKDLKRQLAHTLLCWGKYHEAKEFYWQLPDAPEIALGRAIIHCEMGDYHKASAEVDKIRDSSSLSPYLTAEVLFLKARLTWKLLEPDLTHWTWLLQDPESEQQIEKLREALQGIEQQFALAFKTLEDSTNPNYLEKRLLKNIELYHKAIQLECNVPTMDEFERLRPYLEDTSLPPGFQIFFTEVLVRSLVRDGKWDDADRLCSDAIERFPWVLGFYHLRALARFQCNELSESLADLEKTMALDKWNFIPLDNMRMFMFPSFTHREFNEFVVVLMNRFVFRYPPPSPELIYEKYLSEFIEKMLQREELFSAPQELRKDWDSLLDKALTTDSESIYELISGILAEQYSNPQLQMEIRRLLRERPSGQKEERLQKLLHAMQDRKKRDTLASLEGLLLKYAVLGREEYEIYVYKMGLEGEALLKEILCDPEKDPMMRLLAARMMLAGGKSSTYQSISEIAHASSYPENLLAAVAMAEAGFPTDMPELSEEEIYSAKVTPEFATFYRVILALNLSPFQNLRLATSLLKDREEIVALAAASNFRRYEKLPAPLARTSIEELLICLLQSKDPYIRATACQVFWNFREVGIDLKGRQAEEARATYRTDCWKKHHELILKTLEDPVLEVQFSGIRSIVDDTYVIGAEGNVDICVPEISNTLSKDAVIVKLRYFFEDPTSSTLVKFWSAVLRSCMDDRERMLKIIQNQETPFFIRLGCSCAGDLADRSNPYETAGLMLQLLNVPSRNTADVHFKQIMIYTIGRNCSTQSVQNLSKQYPGLVDQIRLLIEDYTRHENIHVKRAAVAALLWGGKDSNIQMLEGYLNSEDIPLQRVAAATLSALTVRERPHAIADFQKKIEGYPKPVLAAAGYGSYELVQSEVGLGSFQRYNSDFEKGYDVYLDGLKSDLEFFARANRGKLNYCALALNTAISFAPCSQYYYEAAMVAYAQGAYREALDRLEKAVALAGQERSDIGDEGSINYQKVRCLLLQGETHLKLKQREQARQAWEALLQEYPFQSQAHLYLGQIFEEQGFMEQATEHFWHAYLSDSESHLALFSLASCHARAGKNGEAIALLKQYHQKFGLKRRDLKAGAFSAIKDDPWVADLPE